MTRWIRNLLLAVAVLTMAPLGAEADTYPSAVIKIVVGFGPGSGTDILARLLADQLQQSLGQSVIVENKPGAGAQIAATTVARAAPDGYTLFLTSNSSHSVNPHIYKTLSYDPKKDFTPIAGLAYFPFVLAIDPKLPPKTPQEFVAWARANSGKVTYAYGTPTVRIPAAALDHLLNLNATGVGYKSSPPAMMDVIGGQVSFLVTDLASSQAQIKQGQLRALAVTTSQRSELAPELPTIEETLALKDFDLAAWTGLFGPAKLPKEIVDRLSKAVVEIMNRPEVRARILALGAEPTPSDAAAFAKLVDRQYEIWGQKVKDAGIEPE
jgi:putative tricarboxylic transport membrane protein